MSEFLSWWQHLPQNISPVIFEIGWFKIQYYGLMYIVGFAISYGMVLFRIRREKKFNFSVENIQDLMLFMILGLIVGARLGYVLFYNLSYYISRPLEIFLPFEFSNGITFTGISGMSFHGGLVGVIVFTWLFCRKSDVSFLETADLFGPVVALGYTFGRLGNFINGELYGRITSAPVGMYFPLAPGPELRHPSQLYEAFFEGIFLFIVLWNVRKIKAPRGSMLSFYLIGYGTVRFFIEYFRQPDAHLGLVWFSFSMGQILCGTMIGAGLLLFLYLYRLEQKQVHP